MANETRDEVLADLRSRRDAAAERGDNAEALILNDRIAGLKDGTMTATVAAVMDEFDRALATRRAMEPRGCPTPGACSALAEIERLRDYEEAAHDMADRVMVLDERVKQLERWPRVINAALSVAMIRRDLACERGETVYAEQYARSVRLIEDLIKEVGNGQ